MPSEWQDGGDTCKGENCFALGGNLPRRFFALLWMTGLRSRWRCFFNLISPNGFAFLLRSFCLIVQKNTAFSCTRLSLSTPTTLLSHYTRFILVLYKDLPQYLLLFLLRSSLFLSLTLFFLFPFFLFIVVIICYICKFLLLLILLYLNFLPLYSIFLILSKAFFFSLHFYFLHTPQRLYALAKLALYNFTPTIFLSNNTCFTVFPQ